MKKITGVLLAFAMVLNLAACNSVATSGENDTSNMTEDSTNDTVEQVNDTQGNDDNLVSYSGNYPVVVYGNEDVLVFELNADIAYFMEACQDEQNSGLIQFKLPGFTAEFSKSQYATVEDSYISWKNEYASQWGNYYLDGTSTRSFRASYEITDDYIRIICLNHGYDISSMDDTRIEVSALINYGAETVYMGGGEFGASDVVTFINEVPEAYNQPLAVENLFSESDFPAAVAMSHYTDDYVITSNGDGDENCVVYYFDEYGNCVYYDDLRVATDLDDVVIKQGDSLYRADTGEEIDTTIDIVSSFRIIGEKGSSDVYLDGDIMVSLYALEEDSHYNTKQDYFRYVLGFNQNDTGYDSTSVHYCFSNPTLEFCQLTGND